VTAKATNGTDPYPHLNRTEEEDMLEADGTEADVVEHIAMVEVD
jgi:hypothetical protein